MSEDKFEIIVGDTTLPMTTNKKGQFVVSKKDYTSYLDSEGVTKEVREKVASAEEKLLTAGYTFLGAKVVETKENQSMKVGSGDRTLVLGVAGEKDVRNPRTGVESKSYGSCTLQERRMIPSTLRNSELMKKIEDDIEAAFK